MDLDHDRCYAAVASRDPRFDGWFVTGVTSTGIYCRPSCPAITPRRRNVTFFATAAAAHAAGFRACKRCRPDAAPGSPEWDLRADVVGRAMRLIADGTVDRDGVSGLAGRLGYSPRQLQRLLVAEVGAGPQALARAQRAQSARVLIETTDLPFGDVAFAAGFGSIRQFNDTVRTVFDRTPGEMRDRGRRAAGSGPSAPGTVSLRLAHRTPMASADLLAFLADRAVTGVEAVERDAEGRPTTYRRTLALPHGPATVALTPGDGAWTCELRLPELRDLAAAVARCRRLLDLDADPVAVDAHLSSDPLLAPLVAARPGLRVPGAVDGFEVAVRAVVGQQVSVAGAVTTLARITAEAGKALTAPDGPLTHLFPTAEALADLDPASLPMPRARGRALVGLAAAVADGRLDLDPGADRDEARSVLSSLPGIGPWTVEDIALRGLGDPDALPTTDLGVRRTLSALAGPDAARPAAVAARAELWRPWRSYATIHLWSVTP
jgi:AraC family transcriptional regulator of adaptative response / DNA-3-methyladenine glycosylase II